VGKVSRSLQLRIDFDGALRLGFSRQPWLYVLPASPVPGYVYSRGVFKVIYELSWWSLTPSHDHDRDSTSSTIWRA